MIRSEVSEARLFSIFFYLTCLLVCSSFALVLYTVISFWHSFPYTTSLQPFAISLVCSTSSFVSISIVIVKEADSLNQLSFTRIKQMVLRLKIEEMFFRKAQCNVIRVIFPIHTIDNPVKLISSIYLIQIVYIIVDMII